MLPLFCSQCFWIHSFPTCLCWSDPPPLHQPMPRHALWVKVSTNIYFIIVKCYSPFICVMWRNRRWSLENKSPWSSNWDASAFLQCKPADRQPSRNDSADRCFAKLCKVCLMSAAMQQHATFHHSDVILFKQNWRKYINQVFLVYNLKHWWDTPFVREDTS